MSRVQRDSVAGRAYLDLQNLARRSGRAGAELMQLYALEGFLVRLGSTPHASRLVLKGGVLLAAFDARRPTRDVDLAARDLDADVGKMLALAREIVGVEVDDGLIFDAVRAAATVIRERDDYPGVRIAMPCTLATATVSFHIDVNIGDPINPPPVHVALPRVLGGTIEVLGYPLAMVLAEKIVTAIERGAANTRWRDFADIFMLTGTQEVLASELVEAITDVSSHRRVPLRPLRECLAGLESSGQDRWFAWRAKSVLQDRLPAELSTVLDAIYVLADPILDGRVQNGQWTLGDRSWST